MISSNVSGRCPRKPHPASWSMRRAPAAPGSLGLGKEPTPLGGGAPPPATQAGERVSTDLRCSPTGPHGSSRRSHWGLCPPGPRCRHARPPRARAEAIRALKDAQGRLKAFVLRHARCYTGRAPLAAHLRWLSAVVGPTPTPHIVLQADVRAVPEPTARLQRLEQARHAPVHAWRLSPVVEALRPRVACQARWPSP